MYSISPYSFRSYNKNIMGPAGDHYCSLDDIAGNDLFVLLNNFITNNLNYSIVDDTQQIYRFENLQVDDKNRMISVWFAVGSYGIKTDIINIETGNVDFEKAQNNAEILKHYMHFLIPKTFNEGIVLTSNYRGNGIKTLFYSLFRNYFLQITKQVLQMNPLSYDKAFEAWLNARTTEIRCVKFAGFKDIADQLEGLGHDEQEFVLKPKKNGSLGRLKDFIVGGDKLHIIEILNDCSSVVKSVVEMGGKKRTFRIGGNANNILCEIEFDDDEVIFDEGVPNFESLKLWSISILNDYCLRMYQGLQL